MRTVYIIFQIVLIVALFLFVGRTTISFSPFRFSIEKPFLIVGLILAIIAGYCFYFDGYSEGYSKGLDKVLNEIEKKERVLVEKKNLYDLPIDNDNLNTKER